jgi:hypothetical protein
MLLRNVAKHVAVFSLVCLFVPGCYSYEEPEYQFGETDMQNTIVGDWTGTLTLSGQMPTSFTLSIARAPAMQPACGNRTFSSPLCVETSSLTLDATLTTADKVFDAAKFDGYFMVIGTELTNGELSLSGTGVSISGGIEPENTSHSITISGDQSGTGTMQR